MAATKALWLIFPICLSYKAVLAVNMHKTALIIWAKSQIYPLS